jgi:hypothetical protein
MAKPLQIKFYDPETGEPERTFTRSFVPWRIMKRAAALMRLNLDNMDGETVDEMTALVVDVFGDQFSADDVNNRTKPDEMMGVLNGIMAMVNGSPDPTLPGN